MRVISQNGMVDVPYENHCFSMDYRDTTKVIVWDVGSENGDVVTIAKYSTQEKAMKAMEMMKEKYLSRMELDGGYDVINGCYVQPNFWVLPRVFQFPKDEEVEI